MSAYPVDDDHDDVMDVADEVAYADTGRPWTYRTTTTTGKDGAL